MKAKIDFKGTLAEFRAFTRAYKGHVQVEAIVEVVPEPRALSLEDQAKAAARPHLPANKINAIKAVREITSWGLVEAKNFVEAMPESWQAA